MEGVGTLLMSTNEIMKNGAEMKWMGVGRWDGTGRDGVNSALQSCINITPLKSAGKVTCNIFSVFLVSVVDMGIWIFVYQGS